MDYSLLLFKKMITKAQTPGYLLVSASMSKVSIIVLNLLFWSNTMPSKGLCPLCFKRWLYLIYTF